MSAAALTVTKVQRIQEILGVKADGIWGPISQGALAIETRTHGASGNIHIRNIQAVLGVAPTGIWNPESETALGREIGYFAALASSFADPADLVAYIKCKATGRSDNQCFKVGDNGIGQFGKITAQNHTPMVAVHADDMIAKWGTVNGAAHRAVLVTVHGKTIRATVEDRIGVKGRIDLNPAASRDLGLTPPFLVPCVWKWVE